MTTFFDTLIAQNTSEFEWRWQMVIMQDVDNPIWAESIPLFNGKNLKGWDIDLERENQRKVESGILKNKKIGANHISND